ncbi:MAG: NHL repeat-containing protein, partial [Chrysiogenetes bacterium]|nr:NHL repeat-containing protein [Chrysiogenetes bacterium]
GVTATDVYGNRNFGFNGVVRLSSNDPATSPIDNVLQTGVNGGFREFPFTPYTDSDALPGGAMTLSAQDLGASMPTYTTAGITVNGQSATQLFVRFPGETITARSTGPVVLNASDAQEIGVGFQAEVIALDAFGNLDTGASLTDVEISTDDPGDAGPFNAALASGIAAFTLTPSVEGPISVSIDAHTPMSLTMVGARSYRAYPIVLGQAGGGANGAATSATGLTLPTSVAIDESSATRRAFVADTDNHRILGWTSADALANGQAASLVIGQSDLASGGCNRGNAPGAADSNRLCEPRGLALDSQGRLWVADTLNNRILRFNDPFGTDLIADLVLGQANFTSGAANRGGSVASNTLSGPTDVEVDASGNVWVADTGNNRVLRFDAPGDTTADLVVGQTNFTSGSCNAGSTPTAGRLCGPMGLALSGTTLWVADTLNNRVLRFPTPANNTADLALGQGSLTSSDCNGAGMSVGSTTLCLPEDVTPGAGTDLYVSDSANHRVLYYNNPTVSGFPASSALGQPNLTSGSANNPALDITTLSAPADLAWWAGALFIADSANNRVVGRVP